MEKRRKETKEWLRRREQEVRDRLNSPSIVPHQTSDNFGHDVIKRWLKLIKDGQHAEGRKTSRSR
jgi:hypothetical protein